MNGDLYLHKLQRMAKEASEHARPYPTDGAQFAYWTATSAALTQALELYCEMKGAKPHPHREEVQAMVSKLEELKTNLDNFDFAKMRAVLEGKL